MSEVMDVAPSAEKVETGVKNAKRVADGLAEALADTYRLVFKTHAYHWNVEGPLFYPIHKLTEAQYEDMFAATDVIAERMRALGQLAPARIRDIIDHSVVEDSEKLPSAQAMVEDLADDHTRVAKRMKEVIESAEKQGDPVTADLITARSAFHEQAAWMLRATAK